MKGDRTMSEVRQERIGATSRDGAPPVSQAPPAPTKVPTTDEPQRSQKAVKPPKPRKVEKRQKGRKG